MNRVVITGIGVLAPNGIGKDQFCSSLYEGKSGIKHNPLMEELGLRCQVGGIPPLSEEQILEVISSSERKRMSEAMIYAILAARECFSDAGLETISTDQATAPLWDTGCIIGNCFNGAEEVIPDIGQKIMSGKSKRLGIGVIEKTMTSGVSAKIAGMFGLGNKVSTNSSACATGAEAIIEAYYHIKAGRAESMLAGGTEGGAPYTWAGFDAMRIINSKFNDQPESASRPFSKSSNTFVPGSGAGIVYLETYESAKKRGAKIYAEIIGASINCGGQRQGGTMTAPNSTAIQRCIKSAISEAAIKPTEIDYINGHLTGTFGDPIELNNWTEALDLDAKCFPYINGTKCFIGHGLAAGGAQETIATLLQMEKGFIHNAANSDDLYEELIDFREKIPLQRIEKKIRVAAKASFGFGDVNSVLILKKVDQ